MIILYHMYPHFTSAVIPHLLEVLPHIDHQMYYCATQDSPQRSMRWQMENTFYCYPHIDATQDPIFSLALPHKIIAQRLTYHGVPR